VGKKKIKLLERGEKDRAAIKVCPFVTEEFCFEMRFYENKPL
jgi:hypothetical protein